MSDIGSVAEAVSIIGKIVYAELNPSQQSLISEAYDDSEERVNKYKAALLADDTDTQRRLELGIMFGIPASLGPGEIELLERESAIGFNKFNQLAWFQRAEGSRFATKVIEIVRSTVPRE